MSACRGRRLFAAGQNIDEPTRRVQQQSRTPQMDEARTQPSYEFFKVNVLDRQTRSMFNGLRRRRLVANGETRENIKLTSTSLIKSSDLIKNVT